MQSVPIVFEFFSNSKMLDIGFLTTVENREKYAVFPKRYDHLFRVRRVKVYDHHNSKKKKHFHLLQALFHSS
jgi:hypothetical protein